MMDKKQIKYLKTLSIGDIYGIVGSTNSGKTTLLLEMINETIKIKGNIVVYFHHQFYKDIVFNELKNHGKEILTPTVENITRFNKEVNTNKVLILDNINTLEQVKKCFVFIDEFGEFLELSNRHNNEIIQKVLNQKHQNKITIVFCGTPRSYNNLICQNVKGYFLKSLNYGEFINGSGLKKYVLSLNGDFVGGTRLNIDVDKVLFNGLFMTVKYNKNFDKKYDHLNLLELN